MSDRASAQEPTRIVRDGYPPGVTCWLDAELPDPEAAVPFYRGLFGWELENAMPPDAEGKYFEATIDGLRVAGIGHQPSGEAPPPAWNTYVWVESADETAEKIEAAGGKVLMGPMDIMQQGRMAIGADPQGAAFRLWQPGEHRGAQLVNEYRAWGFSGLSTDDLDGAREFYGSVFGWESESGAGWAFFRVPGYGKFLAERDPTLFERLAESGGPEGFADVTAWLSTLEGQPDGTPPHWSVTFNVEDADAAAAKANELGGAVLAEPFDAPPVRMAVVADPQGAAFTVSRFYEDRL